MLLHVEPKVEHLDPSEPRCSSKRLARAHPLSLRAVERARVSAGTQAPQEAMTDLEPKIKHIKVYRRLTLPLDDFGERGLKRASTTRERPSARQTHQPRPPVCRRHYCGVAGCFSTSESRVVAARRAKGRPLSKVSEFGATRFFRDALNNGLPLDARAELGLEQCCDRPPESAASLRSWPLTSDGAHSSADDELAST